MDKPYWYRLLDHWVNTDDNSGLSIPFLVGVRQQFIEVKMINEPVKALFNEIVNAPAFEYCTTIEFCRTIDAYRLGLLRRDEVVKPYFTNGTGEVTLAYKQTEFGGMALSEMIKAMTSKYADQIANCNFSKGSSAFGMWEPFTQADRSFIEKVLK